MKNKRNKIALFTLLTIGSLFGCMKQTYAKPSDTNSSDSSKADGSSSSDKGGEESSKDNIISSSSSSTEKESSSSSDDAVAVAPIYQGMVIENAIQKTIGANTLGSDISDFVTKFPDVSDDNKVDYCVALNQKIKLLVKFHNLDKAKINSLTINGKKYDVTASMTTLEGVRVEVDEYTKSGYDTLTLNSVSYSDSLNNAGTYSEEQKLALGISYEKMITAKVSSSIIKEDKATFALSFENIESTLSKGKVIAYLSDGKNTPISKEITIDADNNATLTFEDLEIGKEYYFGIAASFDLYDGNGLHYAWILKQNFTSSSNYFLDSFTVTQTSISFKVNDEKADATHSAITSVTLMDGTTEVKKITTITETVSFDELLSNHDYTIILEYVYNGKAYTLKYDQKTQEKSAPSILIKCDEITKSSFKYELEITDIDSVCVIDSIKLINGETETVLENNSGELKDLLRNNKYEIKVEYHYNLNDGKDDLTSSVTQKVELLETIEPTLTLTVESDEKNISFKYEVVKDEDTEVTIDKVELFDGTELKDTITEFSNDEGTFTDLYSDQEYIVMLSYHYDLGDGKGQQDKKETKTIKTTAMEAPTVSINANKTGKDFISGSVDISQVYNITSNVKVVIEEEERDADGNATGNYTKVSESSGTSFNFTGLKSLRYYKLTCTYDYKLNTKGETEPQHGSLNIIRRTSYDFTVSNLSLDNTRPIEAGNTVYLSMTVHNGYEEDLEVESIKLNNTLITADTDFNVTGGEDGEIRFKLKTDEDALDTYQNDATENGETTFTVEKVTIYDAIGNEEYDIFLNGNNTVSTKIYGRVSVNKTYFADSNNKKLDYFKPGDTANVIVELNNASGYDLDSINGNTAIEKVDGSNSVYKFTVDTSSYELGFKALNITSLGYHLGDYNKPVSFSNVYAKAFVVEDDTIKYVSTWAHFYSMKDNCVYKLNTDLDFKSIPTKYKDLVDTGKTFDGILDGDGHSIKNLKFASTVENQDVHLGLFKSGSMMLSNLKLENTYFGLDLDMYQDNAARIGYVGGFIGESENAILNNCIIDNRSSINFENNTIDDYTYQNSYVGGFVGYLGNYGEINNCINESSIKTKNGYAGGFAGYLAGSINNCYNVGTVSSDQSTKNTAGAFVGIFNRWSNTCQISNSVNLGPDRFYSSTIRVIGYCYGASTLKKYQAVNVYNLTKLYDSTYDKTMGINRLTRAKITKEFFTEDLKFDTTIWDVDNVDANKKQYPTLKVFNK